MVDYTQREHPLVRVILGEGQLSMIPNSFLNNQPDCPECITGNLHAGNWNTIGTTPYVNAIDYPTNYIRNIDGGAGCAIVDFPDSGLTTETIVSVKLYIQHQVDMGFAYCVGLWVNSAWTRVLYQEQTSGWELEEVDLSSYLNTVQKLNDARIRLYHNLSSGVGILVDALYMVVKYVKSSDVSPDDIATIVTRLENGIDQLTMIANNDIGKSYLGTFHTGDMIGVKFAFLEDNPNWNNIKESFKGKIYELSPSISRSGEHMSLIAYAHPAIGIKQMRVSDEYGTAAYRTDYISEIDPTDGDAYTETALSGDGSNPWQWTAYLGSNLRITSGGIIGSNCVAIDGFKDAGHTYITLALHHEFDNWLEGNLHLYLRSIPYNQLPLRISIVTGTGTFYKDTTVATTWDEKKWDVGDGDWTTIDEPDWFDIDSIYFTVDLGSETDITLQIDGLHMEGYRISRSQYTTSRAIICDMVDRYVNKILDSSSSSGYNVNTDYVYEDTITDRKTIPFVSFPFQDAFASLQDIIKLILSQRYRYYIGHPTEPKNGIHWIVDVDGNLCVAPVGNHNVYGKTGYLVENKWVTRPMGTTPLVVRNDMISNNFKTEILPANLVLVAGKFVFPKDEFWTENHPTYWLSGYWTDDYTVTFYNESRTGHKTLGLWSLRMKGTSSNDAHYESGTTKNPLTGGQDLNLNVKTISTKNNIPTINFSIARNNKVANTLEIRVGINTSNYWKLNVLDKVTVPTDETPVQVSIHIGPQAVDEKWVKVGNPSWEQINYISFRWWKVATIISEYATVYVDGLEIVGNVIRGAKDSTLITNTDCRMVTVRNSLAQTDSLDANDDSSPLALNALYELLRLRIPVTTGSIIVPLNTLFMGGQIVHIHANCTSPLDTAEGSRVYSINRDFRITRVVHSVNMNVASTTLDLTDDVESSVPYDSQDPYSIVLRAIDPNSIMQQKTVASMRTASDFEALSKAIIKNYPS